ncbi:MAG: terminase family protein [Planctomycetes bacterium]|nr:terminase family protein [Planctomycetota bacterium]
MPTATVPRRLSPAAFFRDMGYAPHPGQWAIHHSTAHRRVVACGVRWGKTLCAAMEGLCAAMQPKERSIGWVVAPTYDLADKVYRELIVLAAEHLRHRIITLKESERRLVLRNLAGGVSEIRGKSADNPVSLLGEGLDWVIVDEAARMKPLIWESHLSQRLLDRHGWALLISTPRGKGWYYDLFRRGQGLDPDYQSWNHPSWTNPYVSAELIEQERDRLPERVFKQEYGGEFQEGAGQVFRYVRESATGAWQEPKPREYYYAGLDLAKVEDYSVVCIVNRNREVVFADRFHRLDWSVQVNRIRAAADRYHRARLLVDSTGAGEPVFESLRRAGCNALAYPFTARSKAALVDNLALMFEQRLITLPRADLWPAGIDELESFEFSVTDAGNVKTGAPSGVHDDCVVALGLAAWQVRPSRPVPMVYV